MSIGAPAYSPLPAFVGTAPDSDTEVICWGATSMLIQNSNQPILITFGRGISGAIQYEWQPVPFLPVVGTILRRFDAFKLRAQTPAAQLPPGALQAYVIVTPR